MTRDARTITAGDGVRCEAELATARGTARMGVVLCHPHPRYGGTMRSIVTSALFGALPERGYTCLRFNFRGVEGSEGTWGEGVDEPLDVVAAIDALAHDVPPATPLAVAGWSFGADMALAVTDSRLSGWIGIAPPLRFRARFGAAADPRPKHLVLAENDEFRAPHEILETVASWAATTVEVVGGASHFFVGRTDRVVDATDTFLRTLET